MARSQSMLQSTTDSQDQLFCWQIALLADRRSFRTLDAESDPESGQGECHGVLFFLLSYQETGWRPWETLTRTATVSLNPMLTQHLHTLSDPISVGLHIRNREPSTQE